MRKITFFVFLSALLPNLFAEVSLPPILGDNALLQSSDATRIWGKSTPNENVQVTLNTPSPIKARTQANANGDWEVKLDLRELKDVPPFTMTIAGEKNEISVRNLLIGEVWLASGQSNMEKNVGPRWGQFPCYNWEKIVAKSDNPKIRMYTVPVKGSNQPEESCNGKWVEADSTRTANFTAIGYFFATELSSELQSPVGIIHSSLGGTNIQQWIPQKSLSIIPTLKQKTPANASKLYNAMIHPLRRYTIAGFLWYQGEANALQLRDEKDYPALFSLLLGSWRSDWQKKDLPFYYCQLAGYGTKGQDGIAKNWSELQLAQLKGLENPHTGMAVLTDLGEREDIHPRSKAEVAHRLVLIALAKTYGKNCYFSGPTALRAEKEKDSIVIFFDHGAETLIAGTVSDTYLRRADLPEGKYKRFSPKSQLEGFEVCGSDGKWSWADAVIEEKTVRMNVQCTSSKAVRYHYGDQVIGNLTNSAGLPASPFRFEL